MSTTKPCGKVYVCRVPPPTAAGRASLDANSGAEPQAATRINITVESKLKIVHDRPVYKDFSPLCLGPVLDEKGRRLANTMSGFWQGGKVFLGLNHVELASNKLTRHYRLFRSRRWDSTETRNLAFPTAQKQKQTSEKRFHTPCFCVHDLEMKTRRRYIPARKEVYVPTYTNLVVKTGSFRELRDRVQRCGESIVLLTDSGPQNPVEITTETLRAEVNSMTSGNFGHAYVLGAALLGIAPEQYCEEEERPKKRRKVSGHAE